MVLFITILARQDDFFFAGSIVELEERAQFIIASMKRNMKEFTLKGLLSR